MVDEDYGNLLNSIDEKTEKEWKPEVVPKTDDIKFAISTTTVDQEIWHLNNTEIDAIELPQIRIDELRQKKQLLQQILENLPPVDVKEFKQFIERDFVALTDVERWKLYSFWRAKIMKKLATQLDFLNVEVNEQANVLKDVETNETAEIIRGAHIVGTHFIRLYFRYILDSILLDFINT